MEYPDNFEIPVFPAGKRIAVSRAMAIWISVVFLLIIFTSIILLWSYKSQRFSPLIVFTNDNGEWGVIDNNANNKKLPVSYTMQEYVVGNFVQEWFRISDNNSENELSWSECEREKCRNDALTFGSGICSLYCSSGEDLFSRFTQDVIPNYQSYINAGQYWKIDKSTIIIKPVGKISENGGTWYITADVIYDGKKNSFKIEAFVKVALNTVNYPQTMGFYVADFNSYRIN